jgi:hypothetical protein
VNGWTRRLLRVATAAENSHHLVVPGRLELLIRIREPSRELAELVLAECLSLGSSRDVWRLCRGLGVRASRALPKIVGEGWAEWEPLLGPVAEWDVNAFDRVPPFCWSELVKAGVSLRWSRCANGAEYLPVLDERSPGARGLSIRCSEH